MVFFELLLVFVIQSFFALIDGFAFATSFLLFSFFGGIISQKFRRILDLNPPDQLFENSFYISTYTFFILRILILMKMFFWGLGTIFYKNGTMDFGALNLPGSIMIYVIEVLDTQHVIDYF